MKYKVIMTCKQEVSTSIIVEADNADEASRIALDSANDCVWDEMGLDENYLDVHSCLKTN